MTQVTIRPMGGPTRANWIRLRTMILLRWVAIAGQVTALVVGATIFGLQIEWALCYLTVGGSIIANLAATFLYPENKRLSESENFTLVMFDLLQLGFLLYLTGGLNNPFALLLLGPVTISATALSRRSTIILVCTAVIVISLLASFYLPLITQSGEVLALPQIFVFGHWIALVIAVLFTSAFARRVTNEVHSMSDALAATQMALAREQKLTDLGGVVAAAAHELGTPLATIKLASSELIDDLADYPEMAEDAALIRDQADRCRDILHDMGRAGKDDLLMRSAPFEAVVQEAAEPHTERGKDVQFAQDPGGDTAMAQPIIRRLPEIVHGLRNLIQNAVDFAEATVWIEISWTDTTLSIRITDDGPGFPSQVLGRIGDPFMRTNGRQPNSGQRPGYEGMGLGLFIAKTLLERTGGTLHFANRPEGHGTGALVKVTWPRDGIEQPAVSAGGLGPNRHITS